MFIVHLSLHVAMQNRMFYICTIPISMTIPIPISSPKASPIPVLFPWESHSTGIPISHAHL